MSVSVNTSDKTVRHFRQILLWPVQLMPIRKAHRFRNIGSGCRTFEPDNPMEGVSGRVHGRSSSVSGTALQRVRHLPTLSSSVFSTEKGKVVASAIRQESSIRVFRRSDVAKVRITYPDPHAAPVTFQVAHVDLYFFYDIDVAILVVEVYADDLPLSQAQNALFRFGRCYPTYWEPDGHGGHCPKQVEWLSAEDKVLAVSDYENREKYLSFACRYRAPSLASHWEFLLEPLVLHHSGKKGLLRYRQIEYHLMPLMAYLVVDNPGALTREEFVRLGASDRAGRARIAPLFRAVTCRTLKNAIATTVTGTEKDRSGLGLVSCVPDASLQWWGIAASGYSWTAKLTSSSSGTNIFSLFLIPHFHKAALLMLPIVSWMRRITWILLSGSPCDSSEPSFVRR